MVRSRLILISTLAAGGLTVGACAPSVQPNGLAPPAAAVAPAPVPDHDWFLSIHDGEARLAYGQEASDDLRLGLDCAKGSRQLMLSAMAPRGAAAELHLESGGETERFVAESEPSELDEGDFLTAGATTDQPVFLRFRNVGWIAQWRGETRETYAPHPGSVGNISRFFDFCDARLGD